MDKKSVLLVCRRVQGGMKSHLCSLAEGLLAEGFDISVASPLENLTISPRVKLYKVEIPGTPAAINKIVELSRLIKHHKYSLVHTHGYSAGIYGRIAALVSKNAKLVHTVHNFFPNLSPLWVYGGKNAELWLSRHTHKIITVSEHLRVSLIEIGIQPDKLVTIYNGINAGRFLGKDKAKARQLLGLTSQDFAVGTIARLIPAKGIDVFLQALALVIQKHSLIRGIVIGDGPQKDELLTMAQNLGLSKRVSFLGHREDIPELLPAFDIFVLPSHQEGFGLTLVESQWSGVPVIAADTGGIREIIAQGENGLLFPAGDFTNLSGQIASLLNNKDYRNRLAKKGSETVHDRFPADKMIKSTAKLYHNLIN